MYMPSITVGQAALIYSWQGTVLLFRSLGDLWLNMYSIILTWSILDHTQIVKEMILICDYKLLQPIYAGPGKEQLFYRLYSLLKHARCLRKACNSLYHSSIGLPFLCLMLFDLNLIATKTISHALLKCLISCLCLIQRNIDECSNHCMSPL